MIQLISIPRARVSWYWSRCWFSCSGLWVPTEVEYPSAADTLHIWCVHQAADILLNIIWCSLGSSKPGCGSVYKVEKPDTVSSVTVSGVTVSGVTVPGCQGVRCHGARCHGIYGVPVMAIQLLYTVYSSSINITVADHWMNEWLNEYIEHDCEKAICIKHSFKIPNF